ncbi:DBP6 [Candida theae]|uniref:ATP-dependent RNA helicase n=1 Tax=Candida theae TaxID=1198502 RepID=A0AAD5BBG2_9ASCO|nr:DBP6 [Candida theae]KAI5950221.1 DBP6 [Candida theae]
MFGTRYDPEDRDSVHASNSKRKREEESDSSDSEEDEVHVSEEGRDDATTEANDNSDLETEETQAESDPSYQSKHQAVFSKYKQSVAAVEQSESAHNEDKEDDEEEEDIVDTQDLAPLPQPQLPRDKKLASTSQYSRNLDWLTTPQYVTPDDKLSFRELGLDEVVLDNLTSQGLSEAFAVQVGVLKRMIPEIAANKRRPDAFGDILVNASTGSGKTLAYSIPVIQALHNRVVPRVRAIVLVPTKPLINQVKTVMLQLSSGTNLSVVGLKNDISIKEESEKLVKAVPDIVISTPGRLVEHLNLGSINLTCLRFLVIDEADRLLNQSFQNWSSVLIDKINEQQNHDISKRWSLRTQKLIFSATLTTDAGKLSNLNFYKPRLIIVNDTERLVNEMFSVPPLLSEYTIHYGVAKNSLKPLILAKFLIFQDKLANVLIFTKSNESCIRLSKLLQIIMNALSIQVNVGFINSTNNRTSTRARTLKDFSNQKINILIATDLIARGIDLTTITDVVNYDLPNSSREYVHRVGRTARANHAGNAYSFVFGKGELKWFNTISKDIGRSGRAVEPFEMNLGNVISKQDENVYQRALLDLQQQARM